MPKGKPSFTITADDRLGGENVVGLIGTGKSAHLAHVAVADAQAGQALIGIEAHGP